MPSNNNFALIAIIIILLLVLAIIISVVVIGVKVSRKVSEVKRKVSAFSNDAFGTPDIMEGLHKADLNNANTPKSIQSMTSVYEPLIKKDFPEFSLDEVKAKCEAFIKSYLNCLESGNISELSDKQYSDSVRQSTQAMINDLNSRGLHMFYDDIELYQTEISGYTKSGGLCTVRLQTSLSFLGYMKNNSNAVVSGNDKMKTQTVLETDYTYVQDASKATGGDSFKKVFSMNCPNCGAPITNLGAKYCEYCRSAIKEINIYSWQFTSVKEVQKKAQQFY